MWKLRQVMAEHRRDYQIIVVDDASTDSTPAVLSPYIRVLPLTVLRNAQRRGYADSLEIAIREAVRRSPYPKRDALITLQADFTEDPDIASALIKRIEAGADVVTTDARIESSAPRAVRWGRWFLRWMLRRREWAAVGDPLSGLRAYRIVVMKRALDGRGAGRLLTWPGLGANVELLAQTVTQSRRTDAVEMTIMHHRLQRASRFDFMAAWREVRGAASGKPKANARPLPAESPVAVPEPIAIEAPEPARARGRERDGRKRTTGARKQPRQQRSTHEKKRESLQAPESVVVGAAPAEETAHKAAKKRRRPRRKKKRSPEAPLLVAEGAAPAADGASANGAGEPVATEAVAGAKKKSRRGRRGGRGRRKGPRPNNGNNPETQSGNGGEPPPPLAAEGD